MIQGEFGSNDELFFEIDLIAADGSELLVDAMLDTGFSGWIVINAQDLDALDWLFVREDTLQMAQGNATFSIYVGKVRIDGQEFDIPAYAGEEVPEILLGRQWLKTRRLVVDLPSGVLSLGGN
jgi:predicted aspartyl protease